MAIDPVCGMRVDTDDAAATDEYEGKTYYFCSQACRDAFRADPDLQRRLPDVQIGRDRIAEDELAERAGTTVERIRELADLGILEYGDGTFPRRDVM